MFQKLKLLNPKNLEKEVYVYGYHFSWKSHILLMMGTLTGISAVGILFRLTPFYFTVLVAAVLAALPVLVLDMYKKMYEQKRFADASAYMEQMLYSFQKTGKVAGALKETKEIFDEGQMRRTIEQALSHIEGGDPGSGQGVLRESLAVIEKAYGCAKIHMVHELLADAEEFGGDTETSILLVLEDIERFKRRGYRLQAEKKKSHTDNIISAITAVTLCAAALGVLESMKRMFTAQASVDLFKLPVIQISTLLFLLFLLFVFIKSSRSLTDDWLKESKLHESDYIIKSYHTVVNYDNKREKMKSLCLALPVFLLMGLCLILGKKALCLICCVFGMFFLMQHRAGYSLARKDVTEEMRLCLPQWLMEMALLLQNNNVQVSLARSLEDAPEIMQEELHLLVERIKEMPGELRSYTAFCQEFDLPEVQSCMKLMHTVSENGTGNVRVQMNHLLKRVNEMQERADEMQNQAAAFRMKLLFSYPIFGATAKLLLDLTVGMFVMFGLLGTMGGF